MGSHRVPRSKARCNYAEPASIFHQLVFVEDLSPKGVIRQEQGACGALGDEGSQKTQRDRQAWLYQ